MTGAYVYTPDIWPPLIGAVFMAGVGLHCWRRRAVPAALPLLAVALFGTLFLLGMVFEAAAVAPATKIAWFRFQGIWRSPSVIAGLCFVLEYAYPGRWVTRRNLALLSIPILLDIGMVVTHNGALTWRTIEIGADGAVQATLAPTGLIMTIYGVGLVLVNAAVLLWLFVHSPQHRWPVAIILVAQVANRGLYIVDAAHVPWPIPLDPVVGGVLVVTTAYAVALFGFRIFDPLPAARAAAQDQMRDGMMVLDPHGRIASLNPAAASILGVTLAGARGKRPADILPAFDAWDARLAGAVEPAGPGTATHRPTAISLDTGAGVRSCEVELTPLRDFRGLLLGHLLLLRDVTAQQQAQAQIIAQQRSLAMLREREQLARELHDGISQVLGFASLKLSAARKLIADGRLDKADDQLTRLEAAIIEAHADVRETILDLRTAPTGEKPFFAALQHYLDGFCQNYGIQSELAVGAGVDERLLPPEAQMQLFRILQEAFSNARKHAETNYVLASFERGDGMLHMRIQDNGIGFDPLQVAGAGHNHFGLRFMAERAEQLGGAVRVDSAAGKGTCVEVTMPVGEDAGTRRGGDMEISDARADRR